MLIAFVCCRFDVLNFLLLFCQKTETDLFLSLKITSLTIYVSGA